MGKYITMGHRGRERRSVQNYARFGNTTRATEAARGPLDSKICQSNGARKCGNLYKLFMAKQTMTNDKTKVTRDIEPLFNRYASLAGKQLGNKQIAYVKLTEIADLENPLAKALMRG